MARIRMIKPEFFDDPDVGDISPLAALLFIGLWTQADREGRLEENQRRLKVRIFPYRDVDIQPLIVELHDKDMIRRYQDAEGNGFIWIRSFTKHQRPHPKEPASVIPKCDLASAKRRGEPVKETAGMPDSGSLDSGSQTQNLENEENERVCVSEARHTTPASVDVSVHSKWPDNPTRSQMNQMRSQAGVSDGPHVHHALCGRVCMHGRQFRHIVNTIGGNTEATEKRVRTWFDEVIRKYQGHPIPQSDEFKFWNAEYETKFGNGGKKSDPPRPYIPSASESDRLRAERNSYAK